MVSAKIAGGILAASARLQAAQQVQLAVAASFLIMLGKMMASVALVAGMTGKNVKPLAAQQVQLAAVANIHLLGKKFFCLGG
jgi:hypothetical protein